MDSAMLTITGQQQSRSQKSSFPERVSCRTSAPTLTNDGDATKDIAHAGPERTMREHRCLYR